MDVSDEELIAIARSWILRALASAAANEGGGGREDNGHYAKLLSDLRNPRLNSPANASAMCIRLTALAQTVSYLDQNKHQALLMYLLGMSLWLYSEEVVEALLKFVTNLATVSGSFVPQCLDMLVRNFLPPSCGLPAFLDSFTRAGLMTGTFNMEKLRMQASQHIAKKDGVTFSLSLSLSPPCSCCHHPSSLCIHYVSIGWKKVPLVSRILLLARSPHVLEFTQGLISRLRLVAVLISKRKKERKKDAMSTNKQRCNSPNKTSKQRCSSPNNTSKQRCICFDWN